MFFFQVSSLLNTYHDAFVHTSLKESSNIVIEVCLGDYRLHKWHWDASLSHLKFRVKNYKRLFRILKFILTSVFWRVSWPLTYKISK